MNVQELKAAWQERKVNDNDMVTVTGTVIDFWPRTEGEGWTFDPCKFGSEGEWIRLSFKNAPSDGSLQALQGHERTFSAEVRSYKGKPNLTVQNTYEQLHTDRPVDEVDVRADMRKTERAMGQPARSQSQSAYRARRVSAVKYYYDALQMIAPDDDNIRSAVALASGETIDLNKGVFVDDEPGDEDIPF